MAGEETARRLARRVGLIAAVAVLSVAPATSDARALQGALDPSFGHRGRTFSALGTAFAASEFTSMVRQPDGKLLLGGWIEREGRREGEFESVIERRDPAGALDASFGQGGTVTVGRALAGEGVPDLAVQDDGAILFPVGRTVHRLQPDGAPDPTFGSGGISVTLPLGARRVALDAQGRIVVAGTISHQTSKAPPTYELSLARLLPNGNLDPSFGEGGVVRGHTEDGFFGESVASALAIREDGTILVFGNKSSLLAFSPNGHLDPGFGNGGVVEVQGRLEALLALPGNEAAVASASSPFDCGTIPGNFVLSRYRSDGSLDPGFGEGGNTSLDIATIDKPTALALAPDGSIVLAGDSSANCSGELDFTPILARFTASGVLDQGFGQGGWAPIVIPEPLARASGPSIAALAIAPSGQILAAGEGGPYSGAFVLAREPDGRPDPSFGTGGMANEVRTLPSSSQASELAIDPDGEIFALGWSNVGLHVGRPVLLGFRSNGRPDLRFGSGSGFVSTAAVHIAARRWAYVAASDSGLERGKVVRFNRHGRLDSRYGTHGVARLPAGFVVVSLLARSDGGIIALGRLSGVNRPRGMAVFELSPAGRPDRRFGNDGFVLVGFGRTVKASAESARIDVKGRIVLAGTAGPAAALTRLLPSGAVDRGFGRGGRFTIAPPFWVDSTALALDPRGGILLAFSPEAAHVGAVTLLRTDGNGIRDRSFGRRGSVHARRGGTSLLSVFAGRQIVVVLGRGAWGEGGVTLRGYRLDGSVDRGFGRAGAVSAATSRRHVFRPVAVARQADGRIVVAGTAGKIEELGARVELLRFR